MLRKLCATHVEKGRKPREFIFTISTGSRDRDNDRIPPENWSLDEFRSNPVVLWAHRYDLPPIARANRVWTQGNALKSAVEFPPAGLHPLADQVHGLVEAGFLKAMSVGFRGQHSQPNEFGGLDYLFPVELLEHSVVSVPANVEALVGRGCDTLAVRKWLGESPAGLPSGGIKPDELNALILESLPELIADAFAGELHRRAGRIDRPDRPRRAAATRDRQEPFCNLDRIFPREHPVKAAYRRRAELDRLAAVTQVAEAVDRERQVQEGFGRLPLLRWDFESLPQRAGAWRG